MSGLRISTYHAQPLVEFLEELRAAAIDAAASPVVIARIDDVFGEMEGDDPLNISAREDRAFHDGAVWMRDLVLRAVEAAHRADDEDIGLTDCQLEQILALVRGLKM